MPFTLERAPDPRVTSYAEGGQIKEYLRPTFEWMSQAGHWATISATCLATGVVYLASELIQASKRSMLEKMIFSEEAEEEGSGNDTGCAQGSNGLIAVHDGGPNYRRRSAIEGRDDKREFPRAEHPVIRTHPVSGRKAIFVNPVFTIAIRDLPDDEGESILRFLYEHNNKPQFHVRFKWRENSIAFWDNRCVQHIAMWDYFPLVRSGSRVTVKGDKPF